jgi:hypothetical protein
MNEDALRALVRETVARHLGTAEAPESQARPVTFAAHPSFFRYSLQPSDGPCLIEPTVQCNHCGYCESHGH